MSWLILARIVLSVAAAGVQKELLLGGVGLRLLWGRTYSWMLIPALVGALGLRGDVAWAFLATAFAAGCVDALGNLAMGASLRASDLSVFGPLNAFRPVLALAFGWLFLGETVGWPGVGGVAITVAGATLLLGERRGVSDESGRAAAVGWRLAGLGLSMLGAVWLKQAAVGGGVAIAWVGWLVGGWLVTRLTRPSGAPGREGTERESRLILAHAALFCVMQWLTIEVFRNTLLSSSFVYFQLGMVLQVIVGRVWFGDAAFGRRLWACLLMSAGSGLVAWGG